MNRQLGFSLIELMVTVAIIGILAAIAAPSYRNYVQRTDRSEAISELVSLVSQQEKYMAKNNKYATSLADLGYTAQSSKFYTEGGLYELTVSNDAKAVSFTLTASVVTTAKQQDDTDCYSFALASNGSKTSKNKAGTKSDCWP